MRTNDFPNLTRGKKQYSENIYFFYMEEPQKTLVRIGPHPDMVAFWGEITGEAKPTTFTPEAAPIGVKPQAETVSATDQEARRIAGELVKLHRDGHIAGPLDPEARFMAAALATFEATYQPEAKA